MKRLLILVIALLALLPGCRMETKVHSGDVDNPYIEEPLSAPAEKFQGALDTSNKFIDNINTQPHELYEEFVSPQFKDILPEDKFVKLFTLTETSFGPFKQYKKMQWFFEEREEKGIPILVSGKIVQREKGYLMYSLTFCNGDFNKICGLYVTALPPEVTKKFH